MTSRSHFIVALVAAVISLIFASTEMIVRIEDQFGLKLLFLTRGELPPPKGATIVAIDNDSIDWLQRSASNLSSIAPSLASCLTPSGTTALETAKSVSDLPRDFYACLLLEIGHFDPAHVVIDVNFSLPKRADDKLAEAISSLDSVVLVEGLKAVFDEGGQLRAIVREQPAAPLSSATPHKGGFHVESGDHRITTWYIGDFRSFVDISPIPVVAAELAGAIYAKPTTFQRLWFYGALLQGSPMD